MVFVAIVMEAGGVFGFVVFLRSDPSPLTVIGVTASAVVLAALLLRRALREGLPMRTSARWSRWDDSPVAVGAVGLVIWLLFAIPETAIVTVGWGGLMMALMSPIRVLVLWKSRSET